MLSRRVFSLVRNAVCDSSAFQLRLPVMQNILVRNLMTPSRILFSEAQPATSASADFERLVKNTKKLQTRKRRPLTASVSQKMQGKSVISLALAESFDLHAITNDPSLNTLYNVNFIDEEFEDALYLVKKVEYRVTQDISEVFLFEDGVAVFWNVHADERASILRQLERFSISPYDYKIALDEQDRMPFSTVEGNSGIRSDQFFLDISKHGTPWLTSSSILERFAFSQGFAASVKIGVWESLLSEMLAPLSESSQKLKEGKIPWNRKTALIKAGEFSALRHSINLDCNLLNRDFYWNREDIEKYFAICARHFTLSRRLGILNRRLDICEEKVKTVDNMLALRHASHLEWMIIILIVIEVFFDIFHFADRHTPHKVIVVTDSVDTPVKNVE